MTSRLKAAQRAAYLCKADLGSQMVVEMTSLQGIMGREYAKMSGESDTGGECAGRAIRSRAGIDQSAR